MVRRYLEAAVRDALKTKMRRFETGPIAVLPFIDWCEELSLP